MSNELKVSFYLKRESRLEKSSVGENTPDFDIFRTSFPDGY